MEIAREHKDLTCCCMLLHFLHYCRVKLTILLVIPRTFISKTVCVNGIFCVHTVALVKMSLCGIDASFCCSQALLVTQAASCRHTQQDWTLCQQVCGWFFAIHQLHTIQQRLPRFPPYPPSTPRALPSSLPCFILHLTLIEVLIWQHCKLY